VYRKVVSLEKKGHWGQHLNKNAEERGEDVLQLGQRGKRNERAVKKEL